MLKKTRYWLSNIFFKGGFMKKNFLILFFFLVMAQCITVNQSLINSVFKKPKITVNTITIKKANLEKAVLNMNMQIINSNNFAISAEKMRYKIFIYTNSKAFLSATQKAPFVVNSMGTNSVDFLIDFYYSQMKDIDFKKKTIPYILEGDLYLKTIMGKIKIPFKHKAEIPIPQLPKIAVKKIKIIDFSVMRLKASFLIGLAITNPNDFPLKMKDMHYNFNLNGTPVIEQGENNNIFVGPGATEYLNIVTDFDLSKLKSLITSIARQQSVDFDVSGDYQFDSTKFKKAFEFIDSGKTILEK